MRVIETKYAGVQFRSRLEARWAVVFDELGLAWEYEKEGYCFDDGTFYLPDFYLPDLNCWFEVKGNPPTDEEKLKAKSLSTATRTLTIIASGTMDIEFCSPRINWGVGWRAKRPLRMTFFAGEAWDEWSSPYHQELLHRCYELSNEVFSDGGGLYSFLEEEGIVPEGVGRKKRYSLSEAEKLIKADQLYYLRKYKKEHPRWRFGRTGSVFFSVAQTKPKKWWKPETAIRFVSDASLFNIYDCAFSFRETPLVDYIRSGEQPGTFSVGYPFLCYSSFECQLKWYAQYLTKDKELSTSDEDAYKKAEATISEISGYGARTHPQGCIEIQSAFNKARSCRF
jgi:hypothetical protein